MTLDENKAVVLRLYDELYNRGRLALLPTLVAPGFVDYVVADGTVGGIESLRQGMARLRAVAPGSRYIVEDLIAEDDRVAVRVSCSAAPARPGADSDSGSHGVMRAHIAILRLVGDKVVERWIAYADNGGSVEEVWDIGAARRAEPSME